MKQVISFGFKLLTSISLTLLLIEVGLRLFPGVIPLNFLIHFHEAPRTEIARARGLPTRKENIRVLERDDGGPKLRIFKPYTRLTQTIQEYNTVITVELDEMGFCNPPENSAPSLDGAQLQSIDLITLGDSFTTCHKVYPEETWTSRLAALTGYSVYNLGKVKIGIQEYLQILKKFGLQKSPKVVIMNIYEGNDLRDAQNYYDYVQGKTSDEEIEEQPALLSGVWGRYSYALNLLLSFALYWQNPEAAEPETTEAVEAVNDIQGTDFRYRLVFSEGSVIPFNPEDTDNDEVRFARRLQAREIDIGVSQTITQALADFVSLSKKHDFVPIITYTPSAYTAYAEYVIFQDPTLHDLMPWFSRDQRRFLQEQGEALGFIFIDLTPALQAAAQAYGPEKLLYYQRDLHLTAAGHAVIAETLSHKLQDLAIIKEQSLY
jgi:lysophospholipase L1-like esterase